MIMRSLGRSKPNRFRSAATSTSQRRAIQHRIALAFLRFAFSFLAMQMQMMHPMQQMQPRLVLQQAVLKQPAVLSHARPAQPWLGQVHQLGQLNPARPMAMPVAMPTPIVKAVVKPVARPLRWVYAAPMQRNQINQGRTNQVVLRCQELVSMKVMAPEQKELPKELPKEAGCVGDAPSTFKFFGNLASSGFVKSQNDQNVNLFIFVPVGLPPTQSRWCPCR